MKTFSSLFCLLLISHNAFAAEPNTLTPEETAQGWVLLFDGKDASQHLRGYNKEKSRQWAEKVV